MNKKLQYPCSGIVQMKYCGLKLTREVVTIDLMYDGGFVAAFEQCFNTRPGTLLNLVNIDGNLSPESRQLWGQFLQYDFQIFCDFSISDIHMVVADQQLKPYPDDEFFQCAWRPSNWLGTKEAELVVRRNNARNRGAPAIVPADNATQEELQRLRERLQAADNKILDLEKAQKDVK